MRNQKLFYELADYFELYPRRHTQGLWGAGDIIKEIWNGKEIECGSYGCIAGTGAMLLGAVPTGGGGLSVKSWDAVLLPDQEHPEWVWDAMRREFGLTVGEAEKLFDAAWRPVDDDLPAALRALGDGAALIEVTA